MDEDSRGAITLRSMYTQLYKGLHPNECGVDMYDQPSRINCCVAECFLAKLRWCLIELVCQGSKVGSALAFQRTGYCATIYTNLPLPIHACVQESALVCARPTECARV